MSIIKCTTLAEFLKVDATYYDHDDAEELNHSDLEEFIGYRYEYADPAEITFEALIVCAWKRQSVSALRLGAYTARAIEELLERFDEEFGNPEGEPSETTDDMRKVMGGAVRVIVGALEPWCCDQVATYELTPAEVKELLA